jgi:APA family basic amino acid/polyamine antiporter
MIPNIENKHQLVRALGLLAAVSIIIGNVIGTGVFLKARVMTCNLGSPTWVLIAWIAAGFLSLAGALTYAELTSMKPEAGGEYVFLRDSFGKASSFLFGWMQIFIAKPGSQAAASVAFAIGMNDFLGKKLAQTLFQTKIFGTDFEITTLQIVAIMVIVIFTTINCATVSLSGKIATALTFVKIALIVFVGVGAFLFVTGGDFGHFSMVGTGATCGAEKEAVRYGAAGYSFAAGFAAAMLGALWGYDGWNNLTFVAGEVKDPSRNIPLAIIGSAILVIILYVFVHIGYFYLLDPTQVASVPTTSSVGATVVSRFFGGDITTFATGIAVALFAVGLMISSLGTLHTSILSGSRIPYAMAQDGLFHRGMARLSVTNVPVRSLIFQGVLACILALSGSFDTLTNYVVFGSWIFYALVTASIFVFRRKYPDAIRPYRAFGYPVVPIVFLLVAVWLLVSTISNEPKQSFIGIFLILAGLPVYYYLARKREKEAVTEE